MSTGALATAAVVGGRTETIVTLHELERHAIQHALEHTRGDRTVAAQLLGIDRTTLYRKLKEYRME
jgi:DNA-binding NtrC family response regulator